MLEVHLDQWGIALGFEGAEELEMMALSSSLTGFEPPLTDTSSKEKLIEKGTCNVETEVHQDKTFTIFLYIQIINFCFIFNKSKYFMETSAT